LSYKKPAREAYDIFDSKNKNVYEPNRMAIPKTVYNREFLNFGRVLNFTYLPDDNIRNYQINNTENNKVPLKG
jgi:hypothetical protein